MRSFLFACFVAVAVAVGAAGALDHFMQRTSRVEFTEPGVRP
jgi:hypothetical protein